MASAAEAAQHIDISERRFRELLDEGVIERQPARGYDLDAVRQAYIRHLREIAAGRVITGDLDPAQERARKDKELADHTALKNAALRKELLPRDEVNGAVTAAFARVRAKLLAVPTKVAPLVTRTDSIAAAREKVADGINDALAELAATVVAGVPVAEGEPADDAGGAGMVERSGAAAEPDREPVGRSRKKAQPGVKRRGGAVGHKPR